MLPALILALQEQEQEEAAAAGAWMMGCVKQMEPGCGGVCSSCRRVAQAQGWRGGRQSPGTACQLLPCSTRVLLASFVSGAPCVY